MCVTPSPGVTTGPSSRPSSRHWRTTSALAKRWVGALPWRSSMNPSSDIDMLASTVLMVVPPRGWSVRETTAGRQLIGRAMSSGGGVVLRADTSLPSKEHGQMASTDPLITGVDFVCVPTDDFEASVAFYGETL